MSDLINVPSYLTESSNVIGVPSYLTSSSTQTFATTSCGDCEVVCTSCLGGECGDCESCTSSCTDSCTSYECGNCEVVCTTCLSSESCCMDDCEDFCMGGCQICESTVQSLEPLADPVLLTGLTIVSFNSIQVTIEYQVDVDTYYARINGANAQASTERTFTFSGLSSNTSYTIEIKVGGAGYADSNWVAYTISTNQLVPWEWFTPKTTGANFNITRDEWLAFCTRINEVRLGIGLASYNFTTSSIYILSGKPFYAWIFLEAATAINEINGQVAPQCLAVKSYSVSQGNDSTIYAWYFDNLKTALNNKIAELTA